jgi:hypothetical protein
VTQGAPIPGGLGYPGLELGSAGRSATFSQNAGGKSVPVWAVGLADITVRLFRCLGDTSWRMRVERATHQLGDHVYRAI